LAFDTAKIIKAAFSRQELLTHIKAAKEKCGIALKAINFI
jgi:hypothetical protein